MAGNQCADIVFCIDASGSMRHTFNEVCRNIHVLIESLQSSSQMSWDVRFDFLAFSSGNDLHSFTSVNLNGIELINALYHSASNQESGRLFTRDLDQFKSALRNVGIEGKKLTSSRLTRPWITRGGMRATATGSLSCSVTNPSKQASAQRPSQKRFPP